MKKRIARFVLSIITVILICSTVEAKEIRFVDVNGPNDPGTGTFGDPFLRIEDAIDVAENGDVIEIRPGLYTGQGNYNLDPNGLAVTIRSIDPNDPNVVANTIIDANRAGRCFLFQSYEDANCVIAGLTIRNAYSHDGGYGGNIYCFYSSPTIRNCVIANGHAVNSGGALYCDFSNPTIINSIICHNSADYYGGGISCFYSNPSLIGCTITGNLAGADGGGFDLVASNPTLANSIITKNTAQNGAGLNCFSPTAIPTAVLNCTIVANGAVNAGGALRCADGATATVKNSILSANDANQGPQIALLSDSIAMVSYSDVQGGSAAVYDPCGTFSWASSNINADPCFVSFNSTTDPNLWDFHLQSAYGRFDPNTQTWVYDSNTSLCIDAGDPNSGWSAEPWPNGKRINIGAYGRTAQASMNGNPADFDIDWKVNFKDFAWLTEKWMLELTCYEDLTGNGLIDAEDMAVFAQNWLWKK